MGTKQKTSSKQQEKLPEFVKEGGEFLVGQAKELATKPYESNVQQFADFTPEQNAAFGNLRDFLSGDAQQLGQESLDLTRNYATQPGQTVTAERVVDENGRLGAIADYMNPYVDAALNPAIARIQEAADRRQKFGIDPAAIRSGAADDARHGVESAMLNRDTIQSIGDLSAKFYSDAFNQALGQRNQDQTKFMQADQLQGGFNEEALNRAAKGAQGLQDYTNYQSGVADLLRSIGEQYQMFDQNQLNALWEDEMRRQGWDFDVLGAMGQALNSAPYERTTIGNSTTKQSGAGVWAGAAGSILGGLSKL